MTEAIEILIFVAIGVVFLVLLGGIYTLFRGGDVARSYSNKLMRLRVLMQFVAIVILMVAVWWRMRNGGG